MTGRSRQKSYKLLEEEESYLVDKLTELSLKDFQSYDSAEELRRISHEYKSNYDSYSHVIRDLVRIKHNNAASDEARLLINTYDGMKNTYRTDMKLIRARREHLEDDNITEIDLASTVTDNLDNVSQVSSNTKVRTFLENNFENKVTHDALPCQNAVARITNIDPVQKFPSASNESQTYCSPHTPNVNQVSFVDNDVIESENPIIQSVDTNTSPPLNENIVASASSSSMLHNNNVQTRTSSASMPSYNMRTPVPRQFEPNVSTNQTFTYPYMSHQYRHPHPASTYFNPQDTFVNYHGAPSFPAQNFPNTSPAASYSQYNPHHSIANPTPTVTDFLIKKELGISAAEPFNGDPTKYHGWKRKLLQRIQGVTLSDLEKIDLLEGNTKGEPQIIVRDNQISSSNEPGNALSLIWAELDRNYGQPNKLYTALDEKVTKFAPIKHSNDVESFKKLARLCRLIACNMDSVEALNTYNYEPSLKKFYLLLPARTFDGWRRKVAAMKKRDAEPKFADFMQYIVNHVEELSAIEMPDIKKPSVQSYVTGEKHLQGIQNRYRVGHNNTDKFCNYHQSGSHDVLTCRYFLNLNYGERVEFIKQNRLCFKCLRNHYQSDCKFEPVCNVCKGKHNSVLHDSSRNVSIRESPSQTGPTRQHTYNNRVSNKPLQEKIDVSVCTNTDAVDPPEDEEVDESTGSETSHTSLRGSCSNQVGNSYSKILLADITCSKEIKTRCYVIIDEQSSSSFISPELVDALGVSGPTYEYTLSTMSGHKTFTSGQVISNLKIRGVNEESSFDLPPLITNDFIPNCMNEVASPEVVKSLPHIARYHRNFNPVDETTSVMMLLGRDSGDLIGTLCYGTHAPYVHKTKLGWALIGETSQYCRDSENICSTFKTSVSPHEHFKAEFSIPTKHELGYIPHLEDCFARLPDDEFPDSSVKNKKIDRIISEGTSVNNDGKLVMPLPFEDDDHVMPDNRKPVFQRTLNTLNRLKSDPEKLQQCIDTMQKYIDAGHVEFVPQHELFAIPGKSWFLPVFPVTHQKKGKVRLVFDSSAVYKDVSLNKMLLQGPDRNNGLLGVLLRFRNGPIGFSADIEAMFHSFYLKREDKDYVRYFWYGDNNPSNNLVQMRAKVHIFRNSPTPAIANFGLRTTTLFSDETTSKGKDLILNNCYVDDCLKAVNTPAEAVQTLQSARQILGNFKIRLHKIASNSEEVLEKFPLSELYDCSEITLNETSICSALGVVWNLTNDTFKLSVELPMRDFTRRGLVSVRNSLYDPLGMVSPVTLTAKLIFREVLPSKNNNVSTSKSVWDEPLPIEYKPKWDQWVESVKTVSKLGIPRSFYPIEFSSVTKQEIHVFSDASEKAVGYVIYMRTFYEQKVNVSFLIAGSKVAPRAATSIPRLELNAALEASKAASNVRRELSVAVADCHYYCDSTVVLGYLQNHTRQFAKYVSRRVELIFNLTGNASWTYVSTEYNPADLASRPSSPENLSNSIWFTGPEFLHNPEFVPVSQLPVDQLPEIDLKVLKVSIKPEKVQSDHTLSLAISRASNWTRVNNVSRLIMSFFNKLDKVRQKLGISLAPRPTYSHIARDSVSLILINHTQSRHVSLQNVHKQGLSPFIDSSGTIRVGGRIKHSSLAFEGRHPVFLPKNSHLSGLIIEHFHSQTKHQGRFITAAAIRSGGFFIEGCRGMVDSYIRKCIICQKLRGRPVIPIMADLPPDRVEESPPFTHVGLDLFGPFLVTDGKHTRKTSATKKVWGVVFICLVTRAVHIETVPGLDTSSFQNSLRRFFAIRGVCKTIRSDNGTNLVSARHQLESTFALDILQQEALKNNCLWKTNPPGASHFGGSWERAIGSIRKILDASLLQIGHRALSRDELETLLKEASAIINNTPLYEASSDANDPVPITPANLLLLKDHPNPSTVESFSENDLNAYAKNRWKRIQHLSNEFWQRWRKYYLTSLQRRSKWKNNCPNLKEGDLILLCDKQAKRNDWKCGVIDSVCLSLDGVVRSCFVKTAKGCFRRAVKDIILLNRR